MKLPILTVLSALLVLAERHAGYEYKLLTPTSRKAPVYSEDGNARSQ
jgi:hypothetical protein